MEVASHAQIAELADSLGRGTPGHADQVNELSSENTGHSISGQASFQRYQVAVITTRPEGEFFAGPTPGSLREPPPRIPTPACKDEDLVEECLKGNEHAWAAVVDKYKKLVYAAPMKYCMSPQDAADVFQEVWLDLYTQLGNLRKPGALRSWLIAVAVHKCFQWKRRRIQMAEQQAGEFDREPVTKRCSSPGGRSRRRSIGGGEISRPSSARVPGRD